MRVWSIARGSAEITPEPGDEVVLSGYRDQIESVTFSPDQQYILFTGNQTGGVHLRPTPPEVISDELLWSVSDYCIPVNTRRELLGQTISPATADFERCQRTVRFKR